MQMQFFFSIFFSMKVMAVPPGEILWEVTKPGLSAPNYLFGTHHHLPFRKDSLPEELVMALKNSKVGLFEVIFRERTGDYITTLKKRRTWLPNEETLSSYIGEERTQKVFSALQFALSKLDEEETFLLSEEWKGFDLTLTSYEDFNSLHPSRVFSIERSVLKAQIKGQQAQAPNPPNLHKPPAEPDREKDSAPDMKECLLRSHPVMDVYIEKVLSCMGKPVHSLENPDDNLSLLLSVESKKMAGELVRDSDRIIRRLRDQNESSGEMLYEDWGFLLKEIEGRVWKDIGRGYYLNSPVDTSFLQSDIEQTLSGFLTENECSALSDSLISRYAGGIIDMYQLYMWIVSKGEKITRAVEEQLAGLISETTGLQMDIFSLCLPDYQWPEDQGEGVERANQLELDSMKSVIELLVAPRDPKQAQNMLPYFERGGAFAAVGFGHLAGVLRELKAQGYEVRRIDFSTPFKVPPLPSLYESLKILWDKGEIPMGVEAEQTYEETGDIYSNPAKVE